MRGIGLQLICKDFEKCIILATQDVIPADLLNNKNIYLFDNKCLYEINELIENIENN